MSEELVRTFFDNARKENRLAHAYLLWGPETEKRDRTALEIARGLLCTGSQESPCTPCGTCSVCRHTAKDSYAGLLATFTDKKVIEINTIRELHHKLAISFDKRRVVFLPKIERLSQAAANAFLKTLEEPGGETVYLLTTGNSGQLLPTIISRCHRLPFFPAENEKEHEDIPELNDLVMKGPELSGIDTSTLLGFFNDRNMKRDKVAALFDYLVHQVERALSERYQPPESGAPVSPFSSLPPDALLALSEELLELASDVQRNINADLLLEAVLIVLRKISR